MKPLKDRVIIKPILVDRTAGGLYLPDTVLEQPIAKGIVIAINSTNKLGISKDDVVIYQKFSGQSIGQDDYLLVSENDILAIVDDSEINS